MKLPGFIYSALLIGLYAFLQAITGGLEELSGEWWQPVALAVIAAVLKALDVASQPAGEVSSRDLRPASRARRFFLG